MPVNINIQFTNEQAALLRAEKLRTGVPVAETIRRAVRCWLNPDFCELCLQNPQPETIEHTDA
jgi:hypothetical protein